jgi:sugar phosphate permease
VYAAVILPSMLLIGAACALVFPSLTIQATNCVDDHEQGMVSGLLNTSVQVGCAIFLAIVTAVVTANSAENTSPQAVLDSYRPGLVVVTVIALVGLLITATGLRKRPMRQTTILVAESESAQEAAAAEKERWRSATDPAIHDRPPADLSTACARWASLPAGRTPVTLPVWDTPGGGGLSPSPTR